MSYQPVLFPPASAWRAPSVLPSIPPGQVISFDTETCDPGLRARGPGAIRGEGHLVGCSISTADINIYLPFRHPEDNIPEWAAKAYVTDVLRNAKTVVFANAPYDLDWLEWWGLDPVNLIKEIHDIQIQEPLLDEEKASYSLDSLSRQYLSRSKDESGLKEAAAAYGVDPKAGLHSLPARFVGPYAEADTRLTYDVYVRQRELLEQRGLTEIAQLEHRLLPIVFRMRQRGIPVDLSKVQALEARLLAEENALRAHGRAEFGVDIDEWSNHSISRTADRLGITYDRTEKGNASFKGDFLSASEHPFLLFVDALREVNRHRSVYLKDWFSSNHVKGRIHPSWHQLASDEGGTRTGRMACSNPNAQQVPSRSKYGADIRSCFVAEKGLKWAKLDYSQQEPRILVHYAASRGMRGAAEIRDAYCNDPKMDIYKLLEKLTGIERKAAKQITLGTIYGMGIGLLSDKLGISPDAAKSLREKFDAKLPFVREISDECSGLAERRGYIKTFGGRRRHFNFFEPAERGQPQVARAMGGAKRYADAVAFYGQNIRRAYTHKALNAVIQGGAADMTKKAMIEVYEDSKSVPYMQVHDELDYPVEGEQQARRIKEIMEHVYELNVPITAELELGEHWK